jgi:F0F1-type ATP synthase assembly protein I
MLGLLLAFTKLIKYFVLTIQEFSYLSGQFSNETEAIDRGAKYIVNTPTGYKIQFSSELNSSAESLSNQIQNSHLMFATLILFTFISLVLLYFTLDFLIDKVRKFKPWSIILLLVSFTACVLYIEFLDLKETGNGVCFMFTTMISIITGIVLIGYTLIFPNYVKYED